MVGGTYYLVGVFSVLHCEWMYESRVISVNDIDTVDSAIKFHLTNSRSASLSMVFSHSPTVYPHVCQIIYLYLIFLWLLSFFEWKTLIDNAVSIM